MKNKLHQTEYTNEDYLFKNWKFITSNNNSMLAGNWKGERSIPYTYTSLNELKSRTQFGRFPRLVGTPVFQIDEM